MPNVDTGNDGDGRHKSTPTTAWERVIGLAMILATIVAITWLLVK